MTLKEDRILLHCHSHGCTFGAIAAGFDLEERDLFKPGHRAAEAVRMVREDRRAEVKHTAAATARRKLLDEAEATPEKLKLKPPPVTPVTGIVTGIQMAVMRDPCHVGQFRAVGRGEEWARLNDAERALLAEWTRQVAPPHARTAIALGLGTTKPNGEWVAPPPSGDKPPDEGLKSFAELEEEAAPEVVAHGLAFRSRLGIVHGPPSGGKTTLFANVASRITTGSGFAGRPVEQGRVIVVVEEQGTWRHVFAETGGDLNLLMKGEWPIRDAHVTEDVRLVVVDTFAHVSHLVGADLNDPLEVDNILRPLADLSRRHNVAVVVLDHEKWAEGTNSVKTVERPRHSGAKVATADYVVRAALNEERNTEVTRGMKVRVGIDVPELVVYDARGVAVDGADLAPPLEDHDWVFEHLTAEPCSANQVRTRAGLGNTGAANNRVRTALEALAGENAGVRRRLKDEGKPPSKQNTWLYWKEQ